MVVDNGFALLLLAALHGRVDRAVARRRRPYEWARRRIRVDRDDRFLDLRIVAELIQGTVPLPDLNGLATGDVFTLVDRGNASGPV